MSHPASHLASKRLATTDGHTLVYDAVGYDRPAGRAPGVVFLHGLKSDRGGSKAVALAEHCAKRGYRFLRYDMYGHGESSGRFEDGGPTRWRDDAVALLEKLTDGPQILIGSSMGGWVMLLTALARPTRIAGLIGIAAAPDFTEEISPATIGEAMWAQLQRDGVVEFPSEYEPMRISRYLIEDGGRNLILRDAIPLSCPVRLLHGQCDTSVSWQRSMRLAEQITGGNVEVNLVKDGDHRLSRPQDLDLLCRTLDRMVENFSA